GVRMAWRPVWRGGSVPDPPLTGRRGAPPPSTPASCTCGLPAQTRWSAPALAVAAGAIVIRTWSLAAPQGPPGSLVVQVSVTPPPAIPPPLPPSTPFPEAP